jgi:hypothetical protein
MYKLNSDACVEYQSLFIAEGPASNLWICLTLTPLMWRIWWAPNNASRWQMGFNSEFKGLNTTWVFRFAGMCRCVNDSEYFGGMLYLFLRGCVGPWTIPSAEWIDKLRVSYSYSPINPLNGPESSVGIETGYGLDGPGIESRWGPDFSHLSRPAGAWLWPLTPF